MPRATKAETERRRERVLDLLGKGLNQSTIAGLVGWSVGTISNDVKALTKDGRYDPNAPKPELRDRLFAQVARIAESGGTIVDVELWLVLSKHEDGESVGISDAMKIHRISADARKELAEREDANANVAESNATPFADIVDAAKKHRKDAT